jgi:hypothetical protein
MEFVQCLNQDQENAIFTFGTISDKATYISQQNSDEIKKALIKKIEDGELRSLKYNFQKLIDIYNYEINRAQHRARHNLPQDVVDADGPDDQRAALARWERWRADLGRPVSHAQRAHAEDFIQSININNSRIK